MGVGLDRHLVQIVGAAALEGTSSRTDSKSRLITCVERQPLEAGAAKSCVMTGDCAAFSWHTRGSSAGERTWDCRPMALERCWREDPLAQRFFRNSMVWRHTPPLPCLRLDVPRPRQRLAEKHTPFFYKKCLNLSCDIEFISFLQKRRAITAGIWYNEQNSGIRGR